MRLPLQTHPPFALTSKGSYTSKNVFAENTHIFRDLTQPHSLEVFGNIPFSARLLSSKRNAIAPGN